MTTTPPHRHAIIEVMHMTQHKAQHTPAVHVGHVLGFIVDGNVTMDVGGEVRGKPGSFMLVPAGVPHRALQSASLTLWGVHFCGSCLGWTDSDDMMRPFARVRRGGLPLVDVAPADVPWVTALFERLHAQQHETGVVAFEQQRALLTLLLGALCTAASAASAVRQTQEVDDLVVRALAHVEEHALGPLSLQDVAHACAVTASHLATCVKKATGHSVGSWINAIRMSTAAAWLLHSDDTLDDVAERVGLQDKTHFIRQFKKHHGVTPAAWRKRERLHQVSGQPS